MIGHSHIDAAWLWTWKETVEICRETFSNVLELMEKYPELKFTQSSAQFYIWMEERYPEIFEGIRRRVKEGRWAPAGPWVEFDANMPHGETLVRHLIYTKQYFREKFGVDVKTVWLPDTFGFCTTLPQIMAGCGYRYFLTQKLRWNDVILYPFNYFWWEGPDGSRVLAFQTFGGYFGAPSPDRIDRELKECQLKHGFEMTYVLIGYGDHGGGLDEEMVKEARSILRNEAYDAKFAAPEEFFKEVEELGDKLPVWRDELYLQYHRGTYSTQARFKRLYRAAELALIEAEKVRSVAAWLGLQYPSRELRDLWVKVLFNSFHDILAGSSIAEVYEEAEEDMRGVISKAGDLAEQGLAHIASKVKLDAKSLVVFNTLPWSRSAVVELEGVEGLKSSRDLAVVQEVKGKVIAALRDLPPLGYRAYKLASDRGEGPRVKVSKLGGRIALENDYLKAEIDAKTGALVGLYVRGSGENLVDEGRGGVHVQVFVDKPTPGRKAIGSAGLYDSYAFDVWEVYALQQIDGVKYESLLSPESVEVVEEGPVRARVVVKYRFKQEGRPDSTFEISYVLYSILSWIEIQFRVDWRAERRMAKLFVPVTFYSEYTLFDQPYGWVKRRNPLSPNATLYDRAKWEVPGIMWADISREDGLGVSILDDGRYGYDFGGDFIRLTLLRSPRYPPKWGQPWTYETELADQGLHEFRVALYPHPPGWKVSDTVKAAYEFSTPLLYKLESPHGGELPGEKSFLEVRGGVGVVLKEAEDGEGYVLRLYEVDDKEATVEITAGVLVRRALKVNLAEEGGEGVEVSGSLVKLVVKPREIVNIKLII